MNDQIKEWQERVQQSFSGETALLEFVLQTLDNFIYRYLETSLSSNLKAEPLGKQTWGVTSLENSMVNALKISDPKALDGIKQLARSVPKSQNPTVQYHLRIEVRHLTTDQGEIMIESKVNWNFPTHEKDLDKEVVKKNLFKYSELQELRKKFPLAMETSCSLFI
jgi:hypothetical protein